MTKLKNTDKSEDAKEKWVKELVKKELVKEAWGSSNPKVPFRGEYEVEFQPDSATGHSAFYVDHGEGDVPGMIYVKTDYKGNGASNVNERKFIADLKRHLATAKRAGERVNVEIY